MPNFCDNQACALHLPMPDEGFRDMTFTTHNGNQVRTTRWPILRAEDNKQFFFCTACANVAAMLHSLK